MHCIAPSNETTASSKSTHDSEYLPIGRLSSASIFISVVVATGLYVYDDVFLFTFVNVQD